MCGSAICFEGFGEEWMDFYVAGIENCDIRIAKGEARMVMVCSGYREWLSGEEKGRKRGRKKVQKLKENNELCTNVVEKNPLRPGISGNSFSRVN